MDVHSIQEHCVPAQGLALPHELLQIEMGKRERKEEQIRNSILMLLASHLQSYQDPGPSAHPALEVAQICNKQDLSLLAACDASAEEIHLTAINCTL